MYISFSYLGHAPLSVTFEDGGSPRIRIEGPQPGFCATLSVEDAQDLSIALDQAIMEAGEAATKRAMVTEVDHANADTR